MVRYAQVWQASRWPVAGDAGYRNWLQWRDRSLGSWRGDGSLVGSAAAAVTSQTVACPGFACNDPMITAGLIILTLDFLLLFVRNVAL